MAKKVDERPAKFAGFADRTGRFFQALARNQRREWFAAHRAEYEEGWLAPMKALLGELRERLEPSFPEESLAPPKVFRIYRDVRFSKDKSPYKTHIGGYVAIDGGGPGPAAAAVPYVHVGAGEIFIAAGQWMMDAGQLTRFRDAIADERRGGEVAGMLKKLVHGGYTVGSHDTLQRVPRGFPPDHPRADLLKRKGLTVHYPTPPRELLTSHRFVDWLVTHSKRAVPVVKWLIDVTL